MVGIGCRLEFLGQFGPDACLFHDALDSFMVDPFAATLDFFGHFSATTGSALFSWRSFISSVNRSSAIFLALFGRFSQA